MHAAARETIEWHRRYFETLPGARYLARRVIAAAKAETKEAFRLERWLKARAAFDHTR